MAKSCGATQPGADRFSYPYFKIISNGWSPDISIQNIKDNLIDYLNSQNNVNLKLTSCELTISRENIEHYFGQQILIAAKVNE